MRWCRRILRWVASADVSTFVLISKRPDSRSPKQGRVVSNLFSRTLSLFEIHDFSDRRPLIGLVRPRHNRSADHLDRYGIQNDTIKNFCLPAHALLGMSSESGVFVRR
jgi:hypothetical protein